MATVYVKSVAAFDAANAYTVSFGYSGNQCIKNRIVIYNSSTSAVVFDDTTTTYILSHTIPAGTLINGVSYYCKITAYYLIGGIEYSATSSASNIWKCLTTATWGFSGLSEGSIIGDSSYNFSITYSQAEGELVNEYYVVLYNPSGTTYWSSGALYDISVVNTISGLPNNTALYARAYGTTTNGLSLDTGNILVNIDYDVPDLYSRAYLENDKWHGWVKVTTNVLDIEGIGSGTYSFINNEYVDLTNLNSNVTFANNFALNGDFIISSVVYNSIPNNHFIEIYGDGLSITVTFRTGDFGSGELFFVEFKENNSGYVLYSNMISIPSSSDLIHIWIQRKGGLYNCIIANIGVVS